MPGEGKKYGRDEVRKAIRQMVSDMVPVQTIQATVQSVDKEANTCNVKGIRSKLEYFDVLLSLDEKQGFVVYPAQGSKVIIGIIENNENAAFLLSWGEVDEIWLKGDDHEGLPIVGKVTDKLNALEKKVNAFLAHYKTHIHTDPLSGTTGVPTPTPTISNLSLSKKTDLENKKVRHGSK